MNGRIRETVGDPDPDLISEEHESGYLDYDQLLIELGWQDPSAEEIPQPRQRRGAYDRVWDNSDIPF